MPLTQVHRELSVNTALGAEVLLLRAMTGNERLSGLFNYDLDLLSEQLDIRADQLLGTPATVRVVLAGGGERYFNGFINRFSQSAIDLGAARYRAFLVPRLWFLSRRSDCRIFQDKKVPDIVAGIFRDHGLADFELRLSGSYRTLPYCVQYRETDLDFVSRLLEHEGIYYFHEHSDGKHLLVLADSRSAHSPADGYATVSYFPPGEVPRRELERVDDWVLVNAVRSGAYAHDAYDFAAPRKELLTRSASPKGHALADGELFDYQGDYTESGDGTAYSRIRLEEAQVGYEAAEAASDARGLGCGRLFNLTDHPRADQNREYLILSADYRLQSDPFQTRASTPDVPLYRMTLTVMDAALPYRPPRETRKPVVQGPQTAVVVGKSGEEIWTDKYGRVKVQFHWDRYAKADETASCWVRVAQVWAGKNWGGMMIPRIGTEVIVDFLEGDPDQPIVTGRVYNNECMPPYALPGSATMTALKSNSSKGGGGFNEIRLEDQKGSEQLFIHAEKDQDLRVKNDAREWIGKDRHLIVKASQFESVDGDKHLAVKGDQNEKVDGTVSLKVGNDLQQQVGTKVGLDAGQEIHLKGGMSVVIEAGLSVTIKAGGGFIVVGPAGVTISGTPVLINSGGSPGSGSGCSPDAPAAPQEADQADPGQLSDTAPAGPRPTQAAASVATVKAIDFQAGGTSPQAQALRDAAANGTPFCEKCEAARRAQSGQSAS